MSPGRVLLFDNGFDRRGTAEEYSRALELELDMARGTATKVWEFRPFPDEFSWAISSARRLPNGNTLTMFGYRSAIPLKAYEVTRDGTVVWFLQVRNASTIYRATG